MLGRARCCRSNDEEGRGGAILDIITVREEIEKYKCTLCYLV